jgi:hypothetical protein
MDFPLCNCPQQHDESGVMRLTIKRQKKIGRTRTAAKARSVMERYVARNAAICKAGVAILTNVGDGEHAYPSQNI